MLRNLSLTAAQQVVANLGDRGLQVVQNSPVHTLAVAAMPVRGVEVTDENIIAVLTETSSQQATTMPHDALLEAYVETLGKSLVKQAGFARTVVNPICGRIFAKVNEVLTESTMVNIEVVPVRLSAAVASVQTAEMIGNHANSRNQAIRFPAAFPTMEEGDLTELLKTGSAQYDQLLSEMLASHPEGWLTKVYESVFVTQTYKNESVDGQQVTVFYAQADNADAMLVTHLLAIHFVDNPPAGYPMSLTDYQVTSSSYIAASAAGLNATLAQWDRRTAAQTLVLAWGRNKVMVNGPVYDMYLENGGTVEAVYYAALKEPTTENTSLRKLLDNNEAMTRGYMTYLSNYRNAALEKAAMTAKDIALQAITAEINGLTDEQNVCDVDRVSMHRSVQEAFAQTAPGPFAEKAYKNIRSLVCRIMFPKSNANELLGLIDQEIEQDPSVDVRHAAYTAVMRLMAKHLVSQVS